MYSYHAIYKTYTTKFKTNFLCKVVFELLFLAEEAAAAGSEEQYSTVQALQRDDRNQLVSQMFQNVNVITNG